MERVDGNGDTRTLAMTLCYNQRNPIDQTHDPALQSWVERRLADREAARGARDYALADQIREELSARGVEVEDTSDGPRWRVRRL